MLISAIFAVILVVAIIKMTKYEMNKASENRLSYDLTGGEVSIGPNLLNGSVNLSGASFKYFYAVNKEMGLTAYRVTPTGDVKNFAASPNFKMGVIPSCQTANKDATVMFIAGNQQAAEQNAPGVVFAARLLPSGRMQILPQKHAFTGHRPFSISLDPFSNRLFVSTEQGVNAFNVNSDLSLTPFKLPDLIQHHPVGAVIFSKDGKSAYLSDGMLNRVLQYHVLSDGTFSPMSPLIIEVGKDPQNLILSSNGHFAWCLAVLDKTVERFTIGADGSLKRLPLALEATTIRKNEFVEILGYHPSCLVVTPNGKYAFVARPRYNSIAQFKIQPDGAFVLNNTFSIPGAGDPSLLRLDPNGKYLIATNPDNELISLYSIGGDGLLSAANPSNINASQHLIDLTLAVKR